MRITLPALALLALAACAPASPPPGAVNTKTPAPLTCTQEVVKTAAITAPDANDLITVRSFMAPPVPNAFKGEDTTQNGALCSRAMVLVTVHSGLSNDVLAVFAAQARQLDLIEGHAGPPFTAAELTKLLETVAAVEVTTSDTAPAFGTQGVATRLSRADYTAARAAKQTMFCMMQSVHDRVCRVITGNAPYRLAEDFFTQDMS